MNTQLLINWYRQNKRDLPWRNTKDPYKVWLSEIILQQTRVAQGLPYFEKFITAFPGILDLAQAQEQEVLKLWQGLGYYSRARNLHYTAREIVNNFQGIFPSKYKDILKLKGIGEYTAAAIASFCSDEPVPVIDGNVYRVLSRIKGISVPINTTEGKKKFKKIADEHLDYTQPAIYNQAIMEFGALQCTPSLPNCNICPFQNDCIAYQTGKVHELPVKLSKLKIKKRQLHYFLVKYENKIILKKRKKKDIWQNLYELPLIEINPEEKINKHHLNQLYKTFNIKPAESPQYLFRTNHKLTHRNLEIHFWYILSKTPPNQLINVNDLNEYPLPVVIANFLENYNL